MSVNDELLKDGLGRCIRVDGSVDHFATTSYRWGDVAGVLDGTNQYTARVLSLGAIRRGFGEQRIATGGTCSLVLDNADGVLDALATNMPSNRPGPVRTSAEAEMFLYEPVSTTSFISCSFGDRYF